MGSSVPACQPEDLGNEAATRFNKLVDWLVVGSQLVKLWWIQLYALHKKRHWRDIEKPLDGLWFGSDSGDLPWRRVRSTRPEAAARTGNNPLTAEKFPTRDRGADQTRDETEESEEVGTLFTVSEPNVQFIMFIQNQTI